MNWRNGSARDGIGSRRLPPRRRLPALLLGAFISLMVVATACSKGTAATGPTTQPATSQPGSTSPPAETTPPAATSPSNPGSASSSPPVAGELTGTWSGKYSGAYQGTFTLTWTQAGSKLTGNIDLGSNGGTVPINGTVKGGKITFGTVGSTDITYTGSVSGDSMSGTYKVHGPNGTSSGGPWSATRSS